MATRARRTIPPIVNGRRDWEWSDPAWAAYMRPKPVFPPAGCWGRYEPVIVNGRRI